MEHSTDIQNSLLKFFDLQDFDSQFYIVVAKARKHEFENKINYSTFKDIRNRIQFVDYDDIAKLHAVTYENPYYLVCNYLGTSA